MEYKIADGRRPLKGCSLHVLIVEWFNIITLFKTYFNTWFVCYQAHSCGPVNLPPGAMLLTVSCGNTYESSCVLGCQSGYASEVGNVTTTCLQSGQWSGNSINCTGILCMESYRVIFRIIAPNVIWVRAKWAVLLYYHFELWVFSPDVKDALLAFQNWKRWSCWFSKSFLWKMNSIFI